MKRTALYDSHVRLGAKLIEFGGWEMPVQYTGIVDEHHAVRQRAGLFDIGHMGEFFVSGSGAVSFLNYLLTHDVNRLEVGMGQYSLMCVDSGGVVDDLYVFRLETDRFLLIVNASRIEADAAHVRRVLSGFAQGANVSFEDASGAWSAVAVQGSAVAQFIDRLVVGASLRGASVIRPCDLKKNQIAEFPLPACAAWISRTGYTGEDGFEIIAPNSGIAAIWDSVLCEGKSAGIKPIGLGARDTLRTEACYPLYGHELDETITPLEAGLGFFVQFEKGPFLGREALAKQKASGLMRRSVALRMVDKGAPPRPGYALWSALEGGERAGIVTSGTQSPTLNQGVGLALVSTSHAKVGQILFAEIRGKRHRAELVRKPLVGKPAKAA